MEEEARDDVIIPLDAKDIPGSVRRLVEQSLLNVIVEKQSKLDALDFEAQTFVTDTIADYREQMVDALIRVFEKKNVLTAEDMVTIHEQLKEQLFAQ